MPPVSATEIINAILDAFQQAGATAYYASEMVQTHPRKFIVEYHGEIFPVWVYIWSLTHGGRRTLPDEYRIQMTSVTSPLQINPGGYTALLGYFPDLGMFAGFDLEKHRTFTTGSPSIQIDINAIHVALQNGWSFHTKTNDEIAVGIRPDLLLSYIMNSAALHEYGAEAEVSGLLDRAVAAQPIDPQDIGELAEDRQRIVTEVSKYSRDANFRKVVLNAYENRCAVTRAQLRLVDAAHILPVAAENSSDHVSNGIALSPTLHRAYDNCLIYLGEDLVMRINQEKADELVSRGLDGGLKQFCSFLDTQIHLPYDAGQRPNEEYIRRANRYRRIPGYI